MAVVKKCILTIPGKPLIPKRVSNAEAASPWVLSGLPAQGTCLATPVGSQSLQSSE
ncbi:MAG: hypothetical protein PVI97_17780 [Candidatus Thiodiazotropha sp.]